MGPFNPSDFEKILRLLAQPQVLTLVGRNSREMLFELIEMDDDADHVDDHDNDADNDGWPNDTEKACGTDPLNAASHPIDTDKDGICNAVDTDDDGDNLSTLAEGTSDTDNDGVADKRTVFLEGLDMGSAILLGDGGVYVGQQPHLLHFKDTDGDDHADEWRVVLTGFGREDTHELLNSFRIHHRSHPYDHVHQIHPFHQYLAYHWNLELELLVQLRSKQQ